MSEGPRTIGADTRVLLSVVIPVYFNEENIPHTWRALRDTLQQLPPEFDWEVLFVDDGSEDASYSRLVSVHESEPGRVRVMKLTRNFGQVPAIMAGLQQARGDCAVVMAADLQDPPELILELAKRWNRGSRKIVLATRSGRDDGLLARFTSRVFYRLMRRFAIPNMPEGGFDVFLLDRRVIELINRVEEKNTFLQGQILWTGYVPDTVPYTRRRREHGRSRWTLARKIKYFVDGFVTYSLMPIRLITAAGFIMSVVSFSYAMVILAAKLFWGIPIYGWAPTMISILLLSGIQLVMLGIIGEYVWRSYRETRRLPNFVVESILDRRE